MQGHESDFPKRRTPLDQPFQVPLQYWEDLAAAHPEEICRRALATSHPPHGFLLPFLRDTYLIDAEEGSLKRIADGALVRVDDPLLELILLVYLLYAREETLKEEMIAFHQLKDAHFFRGPHELNTVPILSRFGRDPEGFCRAATALGGTPIAYADFAFRLQALPRVVLYYLLWKGDEEFEARLSILFDRSVESHLSADGIWGLVQLVSTEIIRAGGDATSFES